MRARLIIAALAAALLLAPQALADFSCDYCHEGIGGPPTDFPYGVCAHCHHVIYFGPFHDPENPEFRCGNCHTSSGLHYVHHWQRACLECHGPVHVKGPRIFELSPTAAYTREVVEIRGTNFGDRQGTTVLRVGIKRYLAGSRKVLFWSNTEIRFRVWDYVWPPNATYVRYVWLNKGGVLSNKRPLTITRD